jgi:hypothetical protein
MKLTTALFILAVLIVYSCNNPGKTNNKETAVTVNGFQWLAGKWVMQEKEGSTTEEWQVMNDSLMTGRSDFVKGDSIIPFETIKIFVSGKSFSYEAKAAGQNNELPVAFQITSFSDSGFVAENAQHDFPKRISYRKINQDSIHAFIDGGVSAPERRADFYYSRIKQ